MSDRMTRATDIAFGKIVPTTVVAVIMTSIPPLSRFISHYADNYPTIMAIGLTAFLFFISFRTAIRQESQNTSRSNRR